MTSIHSISDAELEVIQVLWREKRPMKISDVLQCLSGTGWKYNTVGTLLLRMEAKGAVSSSKDGRNIVYTPVLCEEEYKINRTRSFVEKLYNGSVKDLAVSLFKSNEMSEEDIEEIKKMFKL